MWLLGGDKIVVRRKEPDKIVAANMEGSFKESGAEESFSIRVKGYRSLGFDAETRERRRGNQGLSVMISSLCAPYAPSVTLRRSILLTMLGVDFCWFPQAGSKATTNLSC